MTTTLINLARQATTADKIYFTSLAIIGYAIGRTIETQIRKQMFNVAFKKKYGTKPPIQPKM